MDSNSSSSPPIQSEPPNVRLQIAEETKTSTTTTVGLEPAATKPIRSPEKSLTLFALRLAVLEKAASGIGTLGFVWATVVLLGGFAVTLNTTDFWFVTVILLIEGTRIFSRSRELEWQHQATWSLTDAGNSSFRAIKSGSNLIVKTVKNVCTPAVRFNAKKSRELSLPSRTWTSSEVPLMPYAGLMCLSANVSKFLNCLQLASAMACAVLSIIKLVHRDFGDVQTGDADKTNRKGALIFFYSLALAEASLFLLEKAYFEWKVRVRNLLEEVSREFDLGHSGPITVRRFFYDAYSKSLNGSIFDGLKMDMVSFSMELLVSDSNDEQLIGVRMLRNFCTNPSFSEDASKRIGTNVIVMERLVEMLNWRDPDEEEMRYSAAEILLKLASKRQHSLRIAGVPGSVESISGLLHEKRPVFYDESCGSWAFNHTGLEILKKLARDGDTCAKIGGSHGLLRKIIEFVHAEERLLRNPSPERSRLEPVKRALEVLKLLASTCGSSGKQLRRDISEDVFVIGYIGDILRHGGKHPELQILGLEILTSLAIEGDAKERICNTGGVVRELFSIFFDCEVPEDHHSSSHVRVTAGEALSMLSLQSRVSSEMILKQLRLQSDKLVIKALKDPFLRVNAARILRNLCSYGGNECFEQMEGLITKAAPTVK